MKYLGACVLVCAVVCVGVGAEVVPASRASALQPATDPVMGDWQGDLKPEGEPRHRICAQVMALGGGAYQANMLEEFDQRAPALAVLTGATTDAGVVFEGSADGARWSAAIQDNVLEGNVEGKTPGAFVLRKVARPSGTLAAKPPDGAVILFDGTNVDEWEHFGGNPHLLNLARVLGGQDRVAYLRTHVWSPEQQDARLEIGSDDGVKVWLNDGVVHANNTSRGVSPGQDKVAISLDQGWNALMLKVSQGSGDWGACVRIRNPEGGEIEGLRAATAQSEPESAAALDATQGYVMTWEVSSPYFEQGKDAKALFDMAFPPEKGDEAQWQPMPTGGDEDKSCRWLLLDNGAMEVHGGGIVSKRRFRDHQLHLEFRTPFMPDKRGQARGNSGVYVQGRYEVQILDSYGLEGLDNECGGIYKIARPRVNMCAPPLQWQTYDITFYAARFDASGKKTQDAVTTVLHNGVPIHQNLALPAPTPGGVGQNEAEPGRLFLQDHGNPVQFRNIWVVELNR